MYFDLRVNDEFSIFTIHISSDEFSLYIRPFSFSTQNTLTDPNATHFGGTEVSFYDYRFTIYSECYYWIGSSSHRWMARKYNLDSNRIIKGSLHKVVNL